MANFDFFNYFYTSFGFYSSCCDKKIKSLVVKDITKFDKGEVKVKGIIWAAQTSDGSEIPSGTECVIDKVQGVTLIVSPCAKE